MPVIHSLSAYVTLTLPWERVRSAALLRLSDGPTSRIVLGVALRLADNAS
jgi:hypothetical protein